jgi:thiol-disulfide isomerase/thioredoxin
MRSPRYFVTAIWWLSALIPHAAVAQSAAPVPSDLLKFRPTLAGVDYDVPPDPAAIAACKVENVLNSQKRAVGWALRDGQGKLLRRFVDTDGNNKMDQWSYYQDGFEVYRESDLDGDRTLDEARWLNAGGTRVATVEKGKVATWKQISAEEASKVFVQGLVQAMADGDLSLLETVMATPAELMAAGVPKDVVGKVTAAATARRDKVDALLKMLVGWNRQTVWNRFDGTFPHVIPAEPGSGLEKDLTIYENAMIFPGLAASQSNASATPPRTAFLQVPDMIKLGVTWKFIELPRAIDPDKAVVASVSGIRAMLFDRANNVEPRDEALDHALKSLADYDGKNAALLQTGEKRDLARYHVGRIPLLSAVIKASRSPEDQLNYNKQGVDSLVAALRSGFYPEGRKVLEALVEKGDKVGSYAAYSLIGADFAMKNDEPGANVLANQKKWMGDLQDFLDKFRQSDEAQEALLQLAIANEFNAEEDRAREQYAKVVETYPGTPAAHKATGSLRRLDLVGKSFGLKGTGLQNEAVDTTQYRGKTVLVVFWASWATPVRDNLPDLIKVSEKYRDRGLEIIGVNLDNERADLEAFLKANPLAWPQVFEGGGIEGRLAVEYGIISLPTMFLVDAEGKVVNRNLRNAADVERQLEKVLVQKRTGGVALDRRD